MTKVGTPEGAVVCVVGLGSIGREVARKAQAFDARVIAVSRSGTAGGGVEQMFRRERIAEALDMAGAVVICTNSDAESCHLIDAAALAAMGPKALPVNVARGDIVDSAALDVTEVEPLAPTSPLWDLPNVIISPHMAGGGLERLSAAEGLVRGEPLPLFHRGAVAQCLPRDVRSLRFGISSKIKGEVQQLNGIRHGGF